YPTIPDRIEIGPPSFPKVFGLPNPYAAGSFQYRDVPWAASPSSPTSYQVTLDDSGTDLVEGQNFGLLPPTLFFGQVTGSVPINGKTQSVPQSGVPVGLLADRVVLGVDSGGGGGNGFTGDQYVTNGAEISTTTDIDTSRVPGAPVVDIYRTGRVGDDTDAGDGSFTYTLPGLSPGSIYTVRLHFAEIQYEVAGQRKFNASINGTQVLFDFDIVAAAGNQPNTAIARDFQATADINGRIVIDFTAGSAKAPLVNAIQVLAPVGDVQTPAKLAIDSGGDGTGNFLADQDVTGGIPVAYWGGIDMTHVWDGAPEAVYHTLRSGDPSSGDRITYTLPGFEPGRAYTVRLHFADFGVTGPGQRKFNVDINNHRVLTDFDVAAAAGQPSAVGYAYAQFFDAVADANGQIVIDFTKGSINEPIVSGVEVFDPTTVVDTTTTDAEGNYALVAYGAGRYTVIQQPPAGWEQVAPNYSNPVFTPTTPTVAGATPVYTNNSAVATADFNGDGRMDLVVASLQPPNVNPTYGLLVVTVYYSQPDGSFRAEQVNAIAYANSVPLVTVGDFDGDHRPDLAFVHSGPLDGGAKSGTYVYVFLNSGDPAEPFTNFQDSAHWNPIKLQPPAADPSNYYSAIASGDIDGDGSDDLVLGLTKPAGQDGNWVYISNIATTPTYETPTIGYDGASVINKVAIADVDGNGFKDVIVAAVVPNDNIHPLPELLGTSVVFVGTRGDATHWANAANYAGSWGPVTGLAVGPMQAGELPNWYTAAAAWLYADDHLDDRPITSAGTLPIYQAGINTGTGDTGTNGVPFTSGRSVSNIPESRPKDQTYNFHLVSGLRMQ
ncbi:MAG TPA: malectin domain-containing carbohydrate-binding protein, partial [Gemmataceae bacterium]|nr:malectin domain-containing carbohydrate-binding protein [Gemmataceae bacterium]